MKILKAFVVVLFVLSAGLLGFAVVVFMGKQAEKTRRVQVENDLDTQKSENTKLTLAYSQIAEARKELEKALETEKKRAVTIQSTLEQEKKGRSEAEQEFRKTQEELNNMKLEYQGLTQELEILQQKLKDLRGGSLESLRQAPGKDAAEVEIPPVVVTAGASDAAEVLVVNREFNFVVVDKGSSEGLTKGELLTVSHGGKAIARIQVEKVYDHFSACAILEENKSPGVQEGDLVKKS